LNSLRENEARYEDLLYSLLPQLYRSRDTQEDLRKFVALFGHELARLRGNMDQMWKDFYIDSCQEWVIPYIADLVGTRILFNQGQRNRADVKNTIHWRKEKGTLGGLEEIAAEISGWGALAVEMFQRLVWSQNLNSLRPFALQALDLSDSPTVARIGTPFDHAYRSVDIRVPDGDVGLYQISNLAFYLWTLPSQPWAGADPVGIGGRRYFFHPLGRNQILYAGGDKPGACAGQPPDADICFPHATDLPIRARDFRDHTNAYWGNPAGFGVYEDGILLCDPGAPVRAPSMTPSVDYAELAAQAGMLVADPGLFGVKQFRISAIRLASLTTIVDGQPVPLPVIPAGLFANNYSTHGAQGNVVTPAMAYSKGLPYNPGTPDFHQPFMVIRIEPLGADPNFPECELVLANSTGSALLILLPAVAVGVGQQMHFYVADDGSTYFARATHDTGPIDRNPNSAFFGAFLPRHLARAAGEQVRPLPGVRPLAHRKVVYRPLCCWDHPPQNPPASGEVAVDPERGRFYFPPGEEPTGKLTVNFRFAIGGQVGAGPFFRDPLLPSTQAAVKLVVAQTEDAPQHTIQAAINAAPAGSLNPVIIEIQDSHTYREALVVNKAFPTGLIIQSAPLETPEIQSPGGSVLQVTGNISGLSLDGLVLTGGTVSVTGTVPEVNMRFCTLDPSTSGIDYSPAGGHSVLALDNTLAGPVTASANVDQVKLTDSGLQSLSASPALSVAHAAQLEHVTVAGDTKADSIEVSNSILFGKVDVAHFETSCFRYSRFPQNTPVVRSFHCTSAVPIFVSLRPGHPGYLYLAQHTSPEIRTGGEEGGGMGVFYSAEVPWRDQNVLSKLGEYLPAGLTPVTMHVLPRTPFVGVKRI